MELSNIVKLDRCPHCKVANPNVKMLQKFVTKDANFSDERIWKAYKCTTCGGMMIGSHTTGSNQSVQFFPKVQDVSGAIPIKARAFLNQALNTVNAPSGSVMLSASSIDAMLKDKGYLNGSLYSRIDDAANNGVLTEEMSKWAHQIRLEANDQRHADADTELPTEEDAKRISDFALALAEYLYVLPARVRIGIDHAK